MRRLSQGYGHAYVRGQKVYAHRAFYEIHRGKIPAGQYIDHLCGVTICVNPEHLEVVTPSQNVTRARRHSAYTQKTRRRS